MISVVVTNMPYSSLAIPSCQISGIEIHATSEILWVAAPPCFAAVRGLF